MPTTLLKLSCPDGVGLLSRISGFVAAHGGNLEEVHQFTDDFAGWFFTRMAIDTHSLRTDLVDLRRSFEPLAKEMQAEWSIRPEESRMRVVLMVSKLGHCLADLLWRWRSGELAFDHGAQRDAVFGGYKARFPVFADYERKLNRTIPVIRLDRRAQRDSEQDRKEAG